jgi:hypothetical protein
MLSKLVEEFNSIYAAIVGKRKPKPTADTLALEKDLAERGLTRVRIADMVGFINGPRYDYFCKCGTKLSEGPEGGFSLNAVCEKCRINYGCLPGYYGE